MTRRKDAGQRVGQNRASVLGIGIGVGQNRDVAFATLTLKQVSHVGIFIPSFVVSIAFMWLALIF